MDCAGLGRASRDRRPTTGTAGADSPIKVKRLPVETPQAESESIAISPFDGLYWWGAGLL